MDNKPLERCPKCNSRLILKMGNMEFENDDTPEKETIGYSVQLEVCQNEDFEDGKPCPMFGLVANKIRHRME